MEGIKTVKLYDNRNPTTVISSKPTSVKLKEVDVQTFTSPITTYYILVELKEGYTLRLDLTEELYNSISETKIEEES